MDQNKEHSLAEADNSVKKSLMLVGLLSGRQHRQIQKRELHYIINLYHWLLCVLCTLNTLMCLVLAWDDQKDKSIPTLIMKVAFIFWYSEVTIGTIILFVKCHAASGLCILYRKLSEVEKLFESLSIKLDLKNLQKKITAVLSMIWIFWALNVAIKVYDYSTSQQQDTIFGKNFRTRMGETACNLTVTIIQSIAATSTVVILTHWIFVPFYYFCNFLILRMLFATFNSKVTEQIAASRQEFLSEIEHFRQLHLRLCDLVKEVNNCFSMIVGCYMGFSILILLIVLYMESFHKKIQSDELVGIYLYWIIWEFGSVFLYIVSGQALSTEV